MLIFWFRVTADNMTSKARQYRTVQCRTGKRRSSLIIHLSVLHFHPYNLDLHSMILHLWPPCCPPLVGLSMCPPQKFRRHSSGPPPIHVFWPVQVQSCNFGPPQQNLQTKLHTAQTILSIAGSLYSYTNSCACVFFVSKLCSGRECPDADWRTTHTRTCHWTLIWSAATLASNRQTATRSISAGRTTAANWTPIQTAPYIPTSTLLVIGNGGIPSSTKEH